MQEITKALIKFHNSGAAAKKSANNPFFKSSYADLGEVIETVRAEAGKCGLTFTQLVDFNEGVIFVRTIIMHESGQVLRRCRTPVVCKDNQDPQKMGSGVLPTPNATAYKRRLVCHQKMTMAMRPHKPQLR